jgi:hypothetical protein
MRRQNEAPFHTVRTIDFHVANLTVVDGGGKQRLFKVTSAFVEAAIRRLLRPNAL